MYTAISIRFSPSKFQLGSLAVNMLLLAGDISINSGLSIANDNNRTNLLEETYVFEKPWTRGLTIAHLHARGLRSALDHLRIFMATRSMDVLTLSETWLSEQITDSELEIDGYSLTRNDRQHGKSAG